MRPNGLFSWTDISLPDPAAGKEFYSGLFGWDAEEMSFPDGSLMYIMFSVDGDSVAGMGPQMPGQAESGFPPAWMSYISVDDVDGTLSKIEAAGGATVMPAMDVMTSGRMAIAADPTGAVFAMWQARDTSGGGVFNRPGAMTWNELATRDAAAARGFYSAVFGWKFDQFPGPFEYWLAKIEGDKGEGCADDDMNGGLMPMDENWPAEMPSHWMVYFGVEDTDATAARATELGGAIRVEPFDSSAGRIAVVADPQGAAFSIISAAQATPAQ